MASITFRESPLLEILGGIDAKLFGNVVISCCVAERSAPTSNTLTFNPSPYPVVVQRLK